MDWRGRFLVGALSEADGTPSITRVLTAVITTFALGWVSAIIVVHIRRAYEPILPDFGGLVLLLGALYGVNRIANVFQSRNGGPPAQ